MTRQACMGGWCAPRDRCPNYHAEDRRDPAERLCQQGHEAKWLARVAALPVGSWIEQPVNVMRPAPSELRR